MVDKHSAPAFSMGHPPTSRKNIHELSPGPASYDNLHPHLHNTSAAILYTYNHTVKLQIYALNLIIALYLGQAPTPTKFKYPSTHSERSYTHCPHALQKHR